MNKELTALIGGVCKGRGYVRVDGYHRLPLKSHFRIPILDPAIDPVDESLPQDDAKAVDRVLPRPLQHLLAVREEFADFLVLGGEREHCFHF